MSSKASKWLISELRRIREHEGLTQEAWGSRIHFSAQHVSNVENGARPVTRDYLAAVDRAFNTDLVSFYKEFVQGESTPVWLRPWLDYEERAAALRLYHPTLIPGLLQTEAYARMVLAACPLSVEERERQVQARIARQVIWEKDPLVRLHAVIDEIALRRGDPSVMPEQLERLMGLAQRPATTIRVVPANSRPHMGWFGPIILADLDDDGGPVGYLDVAVGGFVVTDAPRLRQLAAVWESVSASALTVDQSLDLIKEVGKSWTSH